MESAKVQSLDLDVSCEVDTLRTSEKIILWPSTKRSKRTGALIRVQRACGIVKEAFVTESNKMISVNRFNKRRYFARPVSDSGRGAISGDGAKNSG